MTQVIPDAIRELIERRSRYQEWLDRLRDLQGEFRREVADRVRADYEGRLGEVESELREHRDELRGSLEVRRAKLAELDDRHDARAAELEEAELRFQVGEFDEDEWTRRRSEHENDLAELEGARDAERAAVDELQAVLGQIEGEASAPSAALSDAAASGIDRAADEAARPAAEDERESRGDLQRPDQEAALADEEPSAEIGVEAIEEPAVPEGIDAGESAPEAAFGGGDESVAEEEGAGGAEHMVEGEETREPEAAGEEPAGPEETGEAETAPTSGPEGDFLDELEFLESLSLDDPDSFDAVSRMLDEEGPSEEEDGRGGGG